MKHRTAVAIMLCAAILIAVAAAGCGLLQGPPEPGADEIMLKIKLDLKEDIGLLVICHDVDGDKGSGGISNADKTMLKRDENLYWTFEKRFYENSADTVDTVLRFTVVTEYCDPNYENVYPVELTVPAGEVSFKADFGKSYLVTITGDKTNGYQAVFDGSL
jgi:hypothetical protein